MAWVKIDDHFDEHPKLARVGPVGWGVWLAGLAYCNRNLTDGFIPRSVAATLACFEVVDSEGRVWSLARTSGMVGEDVDSTWVIELLVDAGLWEEVPGGYRVHDYLDYQPSKEQVISEREAARRRMANVRARRKSGSEDVPANRTDGSEDVRPKFERHSDNPVPVPDKDKSMSSNDDTAGAVPPAAAEQTPTNKALIAELVAEYRQVVPEDRHARGDYAFIGRLYNDHGYDRVLDAIQALAYRIDAGEVPEKPLIYLRGILAAKDRVVPLSRASPTDNPPRRRYQMLN
ncbi:MAG: hypothetical protein IMW98_08510 [Firmicutes bacterium]|nr:hypothetical protein [Bacillota bacterium]MBE3590847.1 hypothetical protein [Bacillota bacterium]